MNFKHVKTSSLCNLTTFFEPSSFDVLVFNSIMCPHNLFCGRNELCYLGFIFVISTHGVQSNELHNLAIFFFPSRCLCHVNVWEVLSLLKTFHPNIFRPTHIKPHTNIQAHLHLNHVLINSLSPINSLSLNLCLSLCYNFTISLTYCLFIFLFYMLEIVYLFFFCFVCFYVRVYLQVSISPYAICIMSIWVTISLILCQSI